MLEYRRRSPYLQRFHQPWVLAIPFVVVAALIVTYSLFFSIVHPHWFWSGGCILPIAVILWGALGVLGVRRPTLEMTAEGVKIDTAWYELSASWTDVLGIAPARVWLFRPASLILRRGQYREKQVVGLRLDWFIRKRYPDIEKAIPLSPFALFDWRTGGVGKTLQILAPTLMPGAWREQSASTETVDYVEYSQAATEELRAKQARFAVRYGDWLSRPWRHDARLGKIVFVGQGDAELEVDVLYIGNYTERLFTWQWMWGSPKATEETLFRAGRLRELYDVTGLRVFGEPGPFIVEGDKMAWELAAVSVKYMGAESCFRLSTSGVGSYAYFAAMNVVRRDSIAARDK